MIVTGQHSFPFSSVNEGDSGTNLFSESSDGTSFAQMLEKSAAQYEVTLNSEENRNVELLNESVLNEKSGYQVAVGENGHPVTEKKEMKEVSSQTVADAGAPDSKSGIAQAVAAQPAQSQSKNVRVAANTKLSPATAVAASQTKSEQAQQLQNAQAATVNSSKKIESTKKASAENKTAPSSKNSVVTGKGGSEEQLKIATAAASFEAKKPQQTKAVNSEEKPKTDMIKPNLVEKESASADSRLERAVTVTVARNEKVVVENGDASPGSKKLQSKTATVEEKTVSADKKTTVEVPITPTSSAPVSEASAFEKALAQGVSKADLVRELKDQGSSEILREAKILVKEGQAGEIKLILRPQELGTVKINLILENKHIVGKIFVENNIVKEALQSAFGDLKEVFAEQGMELGALDVFVSQQSQRENTFFAEEEPDGMPLKMAHAVGAVEKHAEIVRHRFDRSAIDIEV